ncbi:toll/interleukin-1 receptor domain-containing protein [Halobacteria archaeon AArc-m2/3/4]|uniref:Toll/interleukin-1 receptor domain-containing protein n=1 Tax=Natronoglomus mannanivorans TaxID=2979990 RepID=A0AAP2YYQ8_9EURY|nr:toll/interleukin-1 receptor domain-containing protein [Halobacteria archaeon AArc-xg1-1]MCU4973289.1 toll/interleukin-1 receptor domain-containing protein [Halobacteria archaeon AArc-m2/3/4]
MTGEQIFVSHAPADLELVQELFSTVKNFPFGVHIALEEVESGRSRKRLEGRLANSDLVVAVLTAESAKSQWINQEIGYALAKGIPVLPLYESGDLRGGFVTEIEGVTLDRENLSFTVFNLLCRLRAELAPLGALSVPNWYIRFPCTLADCGHPVTLELEEGQTKLWKRYEHGQLLDVSCEVCESTYYFDPATIGFVRREGGI